MNTITTITTTTITAATVAEIYKLPRLTVRKVYDRPAIFRRAWEIRRELADEQGVNVMEISMRQPLRRAWSEAELEYAEINAAAVVEHWKRLNLNAHDLETALTRTTIVGGKRRIRYTTEGHYADVFEIPAFCACGIEKWDFLCTTWEKIADRAKVEVLTRLNRDRATIGKRPLTLGELMIRCAECAIATIGREQRKHLSNRIDPLIMDDDGNESTVYDIIPDEYANVEETAIVNCIRHNFIKRRDAIDQQIMEGLMINHTEREIAGLVGISNVAVHKRIVKMREALRELLRAV